MTSPPFPKLWNEQRKPHLFCPGCGHPIVLKGLALALEKLDLGKKTVVGFDIGCALLAWDFLKVDSFQTHHGRTVPTMVGLKMARPEILAIAYEGDGGAYAIGLQSLVMAAWRNDPIVTIVVNNSVYAMTGGQMAPTTLCGEVTDSTPSGKECEPQEKRAFFGPEFLSAVCAQNAYLARTSIRHLGPLQQILEKAITNTLRNNAFSFVEVISVCPTNWKTDAAGTLQMLEKMEQTFPIKEIKLPQTHKTPNPQVNPKTLSSLTTKQK